MNTPGSITGDYLSGRKKIPVPTERRKGNGHFLTVRGASENNLQNVDVSIPLGTFTCVTGVSGSGKSSLVNEILYKRLAADLNGPRPAPAGTRPWRERSIWTRSSTSTSPPSAAPPGPTRPPTRGLFNDIRDLVRLHPRRQGQRLRPRRGSPSTSGAAGGEACQGDGLIKIEMHFLPDIYVPCEVCKGKRYNRETLEVQLQGQEHLRGVWT